MPDDGGRPESDIRVEAHFEQYSGPIPPPGAMRGYEDTLPGSADRILSMAEREQRYHFLYAMVGLILGFLAALALIVPSAFIVSLGFAWQSVGVVIGSIAGTAGTFVYSSNARRKALREKRAALQQPSNPPELPDSVEPTEH